MSSVVIKAQYAPHSEGTKFYLAMLVSHGSDAYVLKVHGPMGTKGRVLHEPYGISLSAGVSEYNKIINAKSKRGYMFREVLNEIETFVKDDIEDLASKLAKKLSSAVGGHGYASELLTALKSVTTNDSFEPVPDDEPLLKEPFRAGPKVEPIRKEDWGSW